MENELIRWMASIFSYPETAIGNLTSGGSIANLIALTAARDHHHPVCDRDASVAAALFVVMSLYIDNMYLLLDGIL